MFICKHCLKEFKDLTISGKANHSRWCLDNPKRNEYLNKVKDTSHMRTQKALTNLSIAIKNSHVNGKYVGVQERGVKTRLKNGPIILSEETKKKISIKALASNHRRLLKSTRPYITKDNKKILLDSSWEEVLAKRLDSIGVEGIRPSTPIKYKDKTGKERKYFPDFYLPKHDLFLDPKNPYAYSVQIGKIEIVERMINLRVIKTLQECKEFSIEDKP